MSTNDNSDNPELVNELINEYLLASDKIQIDNFNMMYLINANHTEKEITTNIKKQNTIETKTEPKN